MENIIMSNLLITAITASLISVETLTISTLAKLQVLKVKQVESIKKSQKAIVDKDAKNLVLYNKAIKYANKLLSKVLQALSDSDIKRTEKLQKEYDILSNKIKELEE